MSKREFPYRTEIPYCTTVKKQLTLHSKKKAKKMLPKKMRHKNPSTFPDSISQLQWKHFLVRTELRDPSSFRYELSYNSLSVKYLEPHQVPHSDSSLFHFPISIHLLWVHPDTLQNIHLSNWKPQWYYYMFSLAILNHEKNFLFSGNISFSCLQARASRQEILIHTPITVLHFYTICMCAGLASKAVSI